MEYPSKRQRVSKSSRRSDTISSSENVDAIPLRWDGYNIKGSHATELETHDADIYIKSNNLLSANSGTPLSDHSLVASTPVVSEGHVIHRRNNQPDRVTAHTTTIQTVVSSIVNVIIVDGSTAIAVPSENTAPAIFSFPSAEPSTIPTVPTVPAFPSFPAETVPTVPAYPFPPAASPAQTTPPAGPPTETPRPSTMSIDASGASSQVVLSSPPSTPPPSTPSMSVSFSSSSASYFPPASSQESFVPAASSASSVRDAFSSWSPGYNSTTSISSSMAASTPIGITSSNFGVLSSNSTQSITSTATRSSLSSSTLASISGSTPSSSGPNSSTFITSTRSYPASTSSFSLSTTPSSTATENSSSNGVVAGGAGNPTGTDISSSPSSTAATGTQSDNSNVVPTPIIVGGVIGALAGLAIILALLLFFFRWRRKRMPNRQLATRDADVAPPGTAQSAGGMTERSSGVPLAAAGVAPGFFRRLRPNSGQTVATTDSAPSERGFQNLGGRKIESVLTSGGDGYGDAGPSNKEALSGSSFYRDSQGTYGGPGSLPSSMYVGPGSPPTSPVLPVAAAAGPAGRGSGLSEKDKEMEIAVMRPSPARTPVTSQSAFAPPTPPPPRDTTLAGSGRPARDGIGRSHPSFDDSRASKFKESGV